MIYRIFKSLANGIANLTWLLCIFYLVILAGELSDLDNFEMPFRYQTPFVLGDFLQPYWPREILISLGIFALYLAVCSDWTAAMLGKVKISGNLIIPPIILLYIGGVSAYIVNSGIDYPTRIRDPELFPVLLMAWCSIVLIPLLLFVNKCLARPSGPVALTLTLVLLFGASFLGFSTWLHYLASGEIDVVKGATFIQ